MMEWISRRPVYYLWDSSKDEQWILTSPSAWSWHASTTGRHRVYQCHITRISYILRNTLSKVVLLRTCPASWPRIECPICETLSNQQVGFKALQISWYSLPAAEPPQNICTDEEFPFEGATNDELIKLLLLTIQLKRTPTGWQQWKCTLCPVQKIQPKF